MANHHHGTQHQHGNGTSWATASSTAGATAPSGDAGGNNQLVHMVHRSSSFIHPNSHVETNANVREYSAAPPSSGADEDEDNEDDDVMSTDESMTSGDGQPKEVKTKFIPSTFAPPEVVEEIRARNEEAANRIIVKARQTRSMTAKKNHSSGTPPSPSAFSPSVASNSSNSSKSNKAAAHQAASPPSSFAKFGKASNAKVAANTSDCLDDGSSDTVQVMTILGKKVTMIDPVRKVFVIDLLSPETCDQIRMMADNHTRENVNSSSATWRTLYTYTKMDLPVVEVKDMVKKYTDQIMYDVKKIVGEIFGGSMKKDAMKLRPRSWKEPHLLLYQQLSELPSHTGIEMHYDGCDITWSAMLTRLDEYEGGGTYFRSLRKTIRLRQGQVLVHPGELYHKGIDITYGIRTLLVCFTDGMNPKILDDSSADTDEGTPSQF